MKPLLPEEAPQHAEDWRSIMNDLERVVMPGVSNCFSQEIRNFFIVVHKFEEEKNV